MKYTGFLCGAFSTKGDFTPTDGWQSVSFSAEEMEVSSSFYYPEFVDFNYGANKNSIKRHILPIGQNIPVVVGRGENEHSVDTTVEDVTLYQAPFGLTLFSIRIDMDGTGNDITAVISRLRNVDSIGECNARFTETVLDPIMKIWLTHSPMAAKRTDCPRRYGCLVEHGNKLKVFQIADICGDEWNATDTDKLIFELGTLAPIGSYDPEKDFSSSKKYFDSIINENSISVFNNWKGLALFDTFTLLGHETSEWTKKNWIDSYFGMIYISELFVKFYLFRLNNDFRINHERADKLMEQFDEFEYSCWFDHVSYNFLPRLIHRAMEKSLEIIPEKQRLYQMIAQQKDKREKNDDQRMNNLLFYLTLFTIFSMVWDASSLLNELYPFETYLGSHIEGFRLVSYTLLLIVISLIIVTRFKKR